VAGLSMPSGSWVSPALFGIVPGLENHRIRVRCIDARPPIGHHPGSDKRTILEVRHQHRPFNRALGAVIGLSLHPSVQRRIGRNGRAGTNDGTGRADNETAHDTFHDNSFKQQVKPKCGGTLS
jgi:hypothetical protein